MKKAFAILAFIIAAAFSLTACATYQITHGTVTRVYKSSDINVGSLIVDVQEEAGTVSSWICWSKTCSDMKAGDSIAFEVQDGETPKRSMYSPRILTSGTSSSAPQ